MSPSGVANVVVVVNSGGTVVAALEMISVAHDDSATTHDRTTARRGRVFIVFLNGDEDSFGGKFLHHDVLSINGQCHVTFVVGAGDFTAEAGHQVGVL